MEILNFALIYLKHKKIKFEFINYNNLKEIKVDEIKIIFIYEYCLSESKLLELLPDDGSVVVNLHNWNGESCISKQAYDRATQMDVSLLTMNGFYKYVDKFKYSI